MNHLHFNRWWLNGRGLKHQLACIGTSLIYFLLGRPSIYIAQEHYVVSLTMVKTSPNDNTFTYVQRDRMIRSDHQSKNALLPTTQMESHLVGLYD